MVRRKLPKSRRKNLFVQVAISPNFKRGLEAATKAAEVETVSAFIRQAVVAEAKRHGVEIKR